MHLQDLGYVKGVKGTMEHPMLKEPKEIKTCIID